jgi:hypothetical protein
MRYVEWWLGALAGVWQTSEVQAPPSGLSHQ